VEEHPGGDAILAHAGDDSTDGFFGYAYIPYTLFVMKKYF
jgi:cytochrome b involved in lipid metabolism